MLWSGSRVGRGGTELGTAWLCRPLPEAHAVVLANSAVHIKLPRNVVTRR